MQTMLAMIKEEGLTLRPGDWRQLQEVRGLTVADGAAVKDQEVFKVLETYNTHQFKSRKELLALLWQENYTLYVIS